VPLLFSFNVKATGSLRLGAVGSVSVKLPAAVGETYKTEPEAYMDVSTFLTLPNVVMYPSASAAISSVAIPKKNLAAIELSAINGATVSLPEAPKVPEA